MNILNIVDDIRGEFNNTIPTKDIMLSLGVAVICAIIINFVYKRTYLGVNYNKSFSLSVILLSLITSIVIRTINSNLSLSLGMVGALSIVRFRTSVKDPVDTIFMFWAITIGIMSGAGLYLVTILSTMVIGLFYIISFLFQNKKDNKKLLVINTNMIKAEEIINLLKKKKCILKTESYKNGISELTFECKNRNQIQDIISMKDNIDIISINIIDI